MYLSNHQVTTVSDCPQQIGRFTVLRVLGQGSQGVVYLAHDPQLDRQVAIKTLLRQREDHSHLLHEARNLSKLEHPGIIPILEIGIHENKPYLVYQFCDGKSLRDVLNEQGKFKPLEAARVISQLLDAITFAHRHGVIHRDLNPANIMLVQDQQPRVMDFGICIMQGTLSSKSALAGTINYLAPDHLANNAIGPQVDIVAIGLMFLEMLTGRQVFTTDNPMAVVYKIINENILPPSSREPAIDEQMDGIIMQALARDPVLRYQTAAEVKAALDLSLQPRLENGDAINVNEDSSKTTVLFLLRRMKRNKDFPAISTHITEINKKTANRNNSSANELVNVILKDYAVTTKLLRLVNNSYYSQFGGEITTLSRAVVILGYEQVRAAAMSIILFEHMNNKSQTRVMKKASCLALMSGILAREQAKNIRQFKDEDIETAFIASIFHNLGRLLTIYYLPDEFAEIENLVHNMGMKEQRAMLSVLGATYTDLGKAIADEWHLPDVISGGMKRLPGGELPQARSTSEYIVQLANFSNELCAAGGNAPHSLEELARRYQMSLSLSVKDIKKLVETSATEIRQYTRILNINLDEVMPFVTVTATAVPTASLQAQTIRKVAILNDTAGPTVKTLTVTDIPETGAVTAVIATHGDAAPGQGITQAATELLTDIDAVAFTDCGPEPAHRQGMLVRGITEITNSMLENYNLNDLLTMVLETIYRGLGFNRVLFCVHDIKRNTLIGRFGFGKDINEVIPNFICHLNEADNIFSRAVKEGREHIVLDANLREYKHMIPDWLRKLTLPYCTVVYPILLNKRCLGIIYADTDDATTMISSDTLKFFKTLRNQAALAIQQAQFR